MSLDLRPLTTNATQQTLQEILEDHAIRAEILWSFIILLHFAALLPLNPMLVHAFVLLLDWASEKARPVLEDRMLRSGLMLRTSATCADADRL